MATKYFEHTCTISD